MALLEVRHNIEVAHRLFELPGKCENIHGHSMWVTMKLYGGINSKGILETDYGALDFGSVKREFRGYLDTVFDHHLLLNQNDPWSKAVLNYHELDWEDKKEGTLLPGLQTFEADPTTENIALWLAQWSSDRFKTDATVHVQETHVNAAEVDWTYNEDQ